MKGSFEASLDHAPVIALIDAVDPTQAFRAGTACWAGGFRLVGISADIPAAPDIAGALGARGDILIGLWGITSLERLHEFDLSRIAFVFGHSALSGTLEDSSFAFIPSMGFEEAIEATYPTLCVERIDVSGGAQEVRSLQAKQPSREVFVQGVIGGDECATYLEAGARALILTNALMSPSLLTEGDYRSVRNYAASVHQAATHLGRNAQEHTA
jgi:2-keto-3-deoxy-6-phosphogluconate aldolase